MSEQVTDPAGYAKYLPYLDVDAGIARLANNKKLYLKLLGNFLTGSLPDDVISGVKAGDHARTAKCAHALKGAAANLSILGLSKLAADIEAAAKSNADISGIMPAFHKELDAVREGLKELLESEA